MKIDELRIGNIVDYETIPYVIHYLYSSGQVGLIAIKHNWGGGKKTVHLKFKKK